MLSMQTVAQGRGEVARVVNGFLFNPLFLQIVTDMRACVLFLGLLLAREVVHLFLLQCVCVLAGVAGGLKEVFSGRLP